MNKYQAALHSHSDKADPRLTKARETMGALRAFPGNVWDSMAQQNYRQAVEGSRDENKRVDPLVGGLRNIARFGDYAAEGFLGGREAARATQEGDYLGAALSPLTALTGGMFVKPLIKGGKLVYGLSDNLWTGTLDDVVMKSAGADVVRGFNRAKKALPAATGLAAGSTVASTEAEGGGWNKLVTNAKLLIDDITRTNIDVDAQNMVPGYRERMQHFHKLMERAGDHAPKLNGIMEQVAYKALMNSDTDPRVLVKALQEWLDGRS